MARIGILRPEVDLWDIPAPSVSPGRWLTLCIVTWITMLAALLAAAPVIEDRFFILVAGIVLLCAFPAAYFLHFSKVRRRHVNLACLLAAVAVGVFQFWGLAHTFHRNFLLAERYSVLLEFFLWVMAFRGFSIRTLTDHVLTIIPAVSCVILVLVTPLTPPGVIGAAIVVLGSVYLLAAENADLRDTNGRAVQRVRRVVWERGPRAGAAVNSWQTIAAVVLIAAALASAGASYFRASSDLGRRLNERLARYVARYLVAERFDYSPDPLIELDGRTPPDGNRVLFLVECERGENWRQQVYATYEGDAWKIPRGRKGKARREGAAWVPDPARVSGYREQGAIRVVQRFHLRTYLSSALPGLFLVTEVRAPVFGIQMGEGGVVHCSGYVRAGDTYEVVSMVPVQGPAPRADRSAPLPPEIAATYLQLPEHLPPRVGQLAAAAAAGARNKYEAALSIQNFLIQQYEYDTRPEPRPRNADFVDHFLFEGKSGYCQHFASAMVVMCRTLGIPARLVGGFVPGELQIDTGLYEVRAKDAHTWVEAFVEGRGWQSFEPTPPLDEQPRYSPAALWEALSEALAPLWARLGAPLRRYAWAGRALAPATLALLCALALSRHRRQTRTSLGRRGATPEDRARFTYRQLLRWMEQWGVPHEESRAPLEYLESLPAATSPVAPELSTIVAAYLRAVYGRRGLEEVEAEAAEAALRTVRGALFRDKILRPAATRRAAASAE